MNIDQETQITSTNVWRTQLYYNQGLMDSHRFGNEDFHV